MYCQEHKKTVCLVGNGDSLKGLGLGRLIDSHDIVVRFNLCKIIGYEEDVGVKCTHWFINEHLSQSEKFCKDYFSKRIKELKRHGLHTVTWRTEFFKRNLEGELRSKGRTMFTQTCLDESLIYGCQNFYPSIIKVLPKEGKSIASHGPIVATLGFGSLCYFLLRYETVNIVGFGHEKEKNLGNYYNADERPSEWLYHDLEEERRLINFLKVERLENKKKIKFRGND